MLNKALAQRIMNHENDILVIRVLNPEKQLFELRLVMCYECVCVRYMSAETHVFMVLKILTEPQQKSGYLNRECITILSVTCTK